MSFSNTFSFGMIFIAIILIECFSQFSIKKYVNGKNTVSYLLLLGIIGYILYAYLLSYLFSFKKLSIANALVSQSSIVLLAIIGYFIFHEKLTTKETIGLLFALISAILLI